MIRVPMPSRENIEIAAVAVHNPLGDGQAQARAAALAPAPGGVGAVEALKDMGQVLPGDAGAVVLDEEAGLPLFAALAAQGDDAALGEYLAALSVRMRRACFSIATSPVMGRGPSVFRR